MGLYRVARVYLFLQGTYKGNVPIKSSTGLIAGHAYSITGAQVVSLQEVGRKLVKSLLVKENWSNDYWLIGKLTKIGPKIVVVCE